MRERFFAFASKLPAFGSTTRGLVCVVLFYVAFGLFNVFMLPTYKPADEPRHVAYALLLAEGKWPKVSDPLPFDKLHTGKLNSGNVVAAANHPPLYYWITAAPLVISSKQGNMTPGVRIDRILTLGMGAAALVYMFRLVRLLFPKQPSIALTAILFVGALPGYINICSLVYNDALGILTAVATLHGAFSILLLGPTRKRFLTTGVWMVLATFTRFTGVLIAVGALGVVAVGIWLDGAKPKEGTSDNAPSVVWSRRLKQIGIVCGAMIVAVLAVSGWFYYRNYTRYGDLTGANEAFKAFHRPNRGSPIPMLFHGSKWLGLHDHLWGRLAGGVSLGGAIMQVARTLTVTAFVGFVIAATRLGISLKRRGAAAGSALKNPYVWAAIFSFLLLLGLTLPIFVFHAKGGNLSARYLFPALWVLALLPAMGFAALRSKWLVAAGTTGYVLLTVMVLEQYGHALIDKTTKNDGIAAALDANGVRPLGLTFVLLVLAIVVGASGAIASIVANHKRVDEADPAPPPPAPPQAEEAATPDDSAPEAS